MIGKQPEMKTLTLLVASREEVAARANAAAGGEAQGAFVSFTSAELLWRIVSPDRLSLIRALIGQGNLSVEELAKRVGWNARVVDAEVQALADAGLVELGPRGVRFDYDELHVDFQV